MSIKHKYQEVDLNTNTQPCRKSKQIKAIHLIVLLNISIWFVLLGGPVPTISEENSSKPLSAFLMEGFYFRGDREMWFRSHTSITCMLNCTESCPFAAVPCIYFSPAYPIPSERYSNIKVLIFCWVNICNV